ncbi:threonine kinase in B12 biosynthesis [Klebsiella pneumoniae]|uniref:Threonine kinase in B12 biosynthesis n=1 Tax=Klebsiella pneumoniae TaxID=573 RepID=A0A377VD85_KLEPN|nr:threonine kinase in B12 biosynthesis [Klebsiella pneumoniae]
MRPGEGKRKGENVAVAQCPASCGELIQGWILGSEKLVSCPVDWYSTVEVETGVPRKDERPLSRAMVDQLLAHWGTPSAEPADPHHPALNDPGGQRDGQQHRDIAATAVATAHHLGHLLDEPTLARLCVALEPTDSTLFRQLTLFDHNTAATQIACPPSAALDLLVLESPLTLRTTDYHQLPREPGLLANASRLQLAWEKVQQACHCGNPQLLGEAATISAIASQQLLPKPGFDALLDLVESAGLYGLNVAHSGSVVGLLLDRRRHDVEFLQWRLADSDIAAHWPQQHLLAMVPGGVILQ